MMSSNIHSADIVNDPNWLPHRYDAKRDEIHFIQASRSEYRAAPFLIDEYLPGHGSPVAVPRTVALNGLKHRAPVHFIFHSAYCCSTLLAQALDIGGAALALREPQILNDLHGWLRRKGAPNDVARVLDGALALLARPFEAEEAVIIKPSNVVNPLIPVILAMRPDARALLLYAPLKTYLGSIARKGMWGRLWVRELFVKLADSGLVNYGFTPEEILRQTDLQIAAIGWLGQHRLFASLCERHPDRVRTLDSEIFLSNVEQSVGRLSGLFGISLDPKAVASSDAFQRNSKDGADFSVEDRRSAQRQGDIVHAEEIEKVVVWAETVASSAGQRLVLPKPLVEEDK